MQADLSNGNPNRLPSPWTPTRVELLIQLWPGELSATQIAKELGGGLSRNAVIGKAKRLNLENRDRKERNAIANAGRVSRKGITHLTRIERMKAQRELAIAFPNRLSPRATHPDFLGITFDQLEWKDGLPSNCRFVSDARPFTFCGQPVIERSSYCASCHPMVYGRIESTPEQTARAEKMRLAKQNRWAA